MIAEIIKMLKRSLQIAEYVWADAAGSLRSKTKVLNKPVNSVKDLTVWSFDGSSTGQAEGFNSDVFLAPRRIYRDPFRGENHIMVFCDCYDDVDLTIPNKANSRHLLANVSEKAANVEPLVGIEQEYVLYDARSGLPYKWKSHQDPCIGGQGPYYCGAGGDRIFGREIIEDHMFKCLDAGINYFGANAEVMASQWEFQIGTVDPLTAADDLLMARYLLARVSEKYDAAINYHPKPHPGDWNGSGGHVNLSTKPMREEGGLKLIEETMKKLENSHIDDLKFYGEHNEKRLTGHHETSSMNKFSWGIGNRGASVRITKQILREGKGYFEDRRPASNLDPNKVLYRLLSAILS